MRKLLLSLSLAGFLLQSCIKTPYYVSTNAVDYTPFVKKGFFIAEHHQLNFDYQTLGAISTSIHSGYEPKMVDGKTVFIKNDPELGIKTTKNYKVASYSDALNELYKKAIELGANGIIDLKFTVTPGTKDTKGNSGMSVIASGSAIKK